MSSKSKQVKEINGVKYIRDQTPGSSAEISASMPSRSAEEGRNGECPELEIHVSASPAETGKDAGDYLPDEPQTNEVIRVTPYGVRIIWGSNPRPSSELLPNWSSSKKPIKPHSIQ
jgi:hypothetical protein